MHFLSGCICWNVLQSNPVHGEPHVQFYSRADPSVRGVVRSSLGALPFDRANLVRDPRAAARRPLLKCQETRFTYSMTVANLVLFQQPVAN